MKTKKNFLKKLTAGLLGFVMTLGVGAAGYAGAASEAKAFSSPYTITIDSKNGGDNNVHWTGTGVTSLTYDGITWSTSVTGTSSFTASATYAQVGSKNNPATKVILSTAGFAGKKITAISVTCFCMSNTGPSLTVLAGSTTFINAAALVKTTSTEMKSTSGTSAILGDSDAVTVTFNSSAKAAICISQIKVTWEEGTVTSTVSLDNQSPTTAGTTSVTATKGSAMPSITLPQKTGYDFGGYYTGTNGTGTQYYTSTGASARNWDMDANTTLYAYWIAKKYNVTGSITNGSLSSTDQISHGTAFSRSINPGDGYDYPTSLTSLSINGIAQTAGTDYTYNSSTGLISINAAKVVGNIVINATCNKKVYTITDSVSNGGLSISSIEHGADLEVSITPDSGFNVPDSITVKRGGSDFTSFNYNSETGVISIGGSDVTGNFEISGACYKEFKLSASCPNGTVSPATTSDSKIRSGQTATFEFTADQNYFLPQSVEDGIDVLNASISSYSVTNDVATLVINNPAGDVQVTCTCIEVADKTISVKMQNVQNVSDTGGGVIQIGGDPVVVTMDAANNYRLPDENKFTVTGADASYDFSNNHKSVSITLSNCVDDVEISGSPVRLYTISSSITNGSCSPASGEVDTGSAWNGTISPSSGYKRPDSITVTMGGSTLTQGTDYTYTKASGAVSISEVTGNVSISAAMVELAEADISVTGSGTYADKFTYSGDTKLVEGGQAQITIAPKTEGDDVYFIKLSDIDVDGADKVSYTENVLTINNLSGTSVEITVTPELKAVTGIKLVTQPSTRTYNIGVAFSTTGAVVHAEYNDGSEGTQNIVSSCYPVFYTNGVEDAAAMFKDGAHTVKFAYDVGENTYLTSAVNLTVNKVQHSGSVTFAKTAPTTGSFLIATKDDSGNWYYLPTATTSSSPTKQTLTMVNSLPSFDSSIAASTYMWNLSYSNNKYTITNSDDKYLYATSSNSGLRVNTTSDTWTISATTNGYKMQETNNSRYCGVYVDGSDWRPYTSSGAANYKETGENIVFYTRTENPGTHEYAGIVAELADPQHQFFAGQSVENSQLTVKKYYDDELGTETLESDQFEISTHTLVAGYNTITVTHSGKSDTLKVYATERTGELVDARIVASEGYQTTYFLDDEHSDWNLDNINLVAIYSDESEVSVSLQSLVDSGQVTINPAQPAEGVTSFTVSGSYDDGEKEVPINSDYNTVSGFTINNKVITQLSWAGRFDYSDHSFNVFEGSQINKNRFVNPNKTTSYLKATFNDGTPAVDYSINDCSVALYERDTEKDKNVFVKDVTFDQNGNYTFEAEDDGLYFLLSAGNAITQYSGAAIFHVCERLNAVNIPGSNVTKTISPTSFTPALPSSTESGVQTYTAEGIGFEADGVYNYSSHIALPKNSSSYLKSNQLPGELVSMTFTKSSSQSMNSAASVSFSKDGVTYDLSQQFNNATFTYSFDTAAKKGYKYFKITTTGSNYTNIASISITYAPSNDIANTDFTAQSKVIDFVKNTTLTFGNWDTVKTNFNSIFTSDTVAKNMFQYATAATGNDADCLQEFVNTYDSIARAYNLVDSTNNFLNRTLGSATAYTYSIEANGGSVSGGSSTSSTYNYGATITLPTTKSKTGYEFDGWYFDKDFTQPVGENPKTVTSFAMPAANTKVYAKWTGAKVNVNFSANDGAWEGEGTTKVVQQTYNQNYVLPETNPSKTGYNFAGWFTQATGGTEITASTKFASVSTITVYAHWNANKINATFNANDGAWEGEGTTKVVEQTFDSNYVLPPTNPEKEGYVFAGWFTQATGGDPVTSSTVFNSAVPVEVYAHWSKIHSINFSGTNVDLDGETTFLSGEPYSATFEAEAGYLLPQTITVTVNGQPFSAYDYDPTDGSFSVASMPEGDMSITVTAFQGAYSITYYDSGKAITTFDEKYYEYEYGVGLDELPTLGNKLGYRFAGWYDNPYYEGSAITSISADDSGAKTFYARWAFNAQSDLDQVTTSIGMSYTYAYRDENAQVSSSTVTNKVETKGAPEGYKFEKAYSIAAGDQVILVCEDADMEMTSISTTSTKYGVGTSTVSGFSGSYIFTVVEGSESNTFAFKNGDNYLRWNSGNSLDIDATSVAKNSSWSLSFDEDGNILFANANDTTREIWWNVGSPRFACYTGKSAGTQYYAVQLYKLVPAGPTLNSIEIVGTPITTYYVGDTYVTTGLSVKATYSDGSTPTVSAEISINKSTAVVSDTSLTFSASYGGKDATRTVPIKVDTEYHDVSFKFNFKNSGMDELVNTYKGVFTDMGLMVEYGGRERYFSFVPDAEDGNYYIYEYNKDGELEKTVTYKMKSGGVFTLSLGDVINNLDRANTEFTVCAYIVVGDEVYTSTNSTTYSVVSWIEYYHSKKDYADAVQDLYDIFSASSGNN
ncbi:MAG: InlB B-repeat-containing protein [Bacilli bacterium]|nr:InlB B-repeat-containing protein [Bacilli bacterium]